MTREARILALLVVAMLAFTGLAAAQHSNEAYVKVTERLDAKAESDGKYVWNYNVTGGDIDIEIYNAPSTTGTGASDTRLFDIWVPIQDDNDTINWSTCAMDFGNTTDYNLIPNDCAVQICYVDAALSTTGCVCGDGTTSTSTDPGRTWVLDYNENLNGTSNYEYVIHIDELNSSSKVVINCDMNLSAQNEYRGDYPITFSETFTPNKIVNHACTNVTVELNFTNNLSTTCDLEVNVTKLLSGDAVWENLNATAASGGGSITGTHNENIAWTGLSAASGSTTSVTFDVNACPQITANTSKIEMGRAYFEWGYADDSCPNGTNRNITVGTVTALGPAEINITKEHVLDSDPAEWIINATFHNTAADLNYTLFRYRLWAENGTDPSQVDPNDPKLAGSGVNCTGLADNVAAGGYYECNGVTFNSDDIPVAFGQPFFQLIEGGVSGWDDYYQFENSKNASAPLDSDYFLIENIWVINNYLIKATKEIAAMSGVPGCYNITIDVENLGPTCSPYVYIYDIVPEEFYNMTKSGVSVGGSRYASPYNIMVSDSDTFATISHPGNAQPLTPQGYPDLTNARYLAYATPPVVTENWTYGDAQYTFNESQFTGKTEGLTGEFAGTGYRWELFPLAGTGGEAEDECPSNTYGNLNISATDSVVISYAVCADDENMTYYPGELFIVGVDPIHAEGTASPPASVGMGSGESSNETLLVLVLVVVAIAAVFLLKKRR